MMDDGQATQQHTSFPPVGKADFRSLESLSKSQQNTVKTPCQTGLFSMLKDNLLQKESKEPKKFYCKLCSQNCAENTWLSHTASVQHCMKYLEMQLKLGYDLFKERFSDVPWNYITPNSIDVDELPEAVTKSINSGNYDLELMCHGGQLSNFNCMICERDCSTINNWLCHVQGNKHRKHCNDLISHYGIMAFMKKFWIVPGPHWSVLSKAGDHDIFKLEIPKHFKSLHETAKLETVTSTCLPASLKLIQASMARQHTMVPRTHSLMNFADQLSDQCFHENRNSTELGLSEPRTSIGISSASQVFEYGHSKGHIIKPSFEKDNYNILSDLSSCRHSQGTDSPTTTSTSTTCIFEYDHVKSADRSLHLRNETLSHESKSVKQHSSDIRQASMTSTLGSPVSTASSTLCVPVVGEDRYGLCGLDNYKLTNSDGYMGGSYWQEFQSRQCDAAVQNRAPELISKCVDKFPAAITCSDVVTMNEINFSYSCNTDEAKVRTTMNLAQPQIMPVASSAQQLLLDNVFSYEHKKQQQLINSHELLSKISVPAVAYSPRITHDEMLESASDLKAPHKAEEFLEIINKKEQNSNVQKNLKTIDEMLSHLRNSVSRKDQEICRDNQVDCFQKKISDGVDMILTSANKISTRITEVKGDQLQEEDNQMLDILKNNSAQQNITDRFKSNNSEQNQRNQAVKSCWRSQQSEEEMYVQFTLLNHGRCRNDKDFSSNYEKDNCQDVLPRRRRNSSNDLEDIRDRDERLRDIDDRFRQIPHSSDDWDNSTKSQLSHFMDSNNRTDRKSHDKYSRRSQRIHRFRNEYIAVKKCGRFRSNDGNCKSREKGILPSERCHRSTNSGGESEKVSSPSERHDRAKQRYIWLGCRTNTSRDKEKQFRSKIKRVHDQFYGRHRMAKETHFNGKSLLTSYNDGHAKLTEKKGSTLSFADQGMVKIDVQLDTRKVYCSTDTDQDVLSNDGNVKNGGSDEYNCNTVDVCEQNVSTPCHTFMIERRNEQKQALSSLFEQHQQDWHHNEDDLGETGGKSQVLCENLLEELDGQHQLEDITVRTVPSYTHQVMLRKVKLHPKSDNITDCKNPTGTNNQMPSNKTVNSCSSEKCFPAAYHQHEGLSSIKTAHQFKSDETSSHSDLLDDTQYENDEIFTLGKTTDLKTTIKETIQPCVYVETLSLENHSKDDKAAYMTTSATTSRKEGLNMENQRSNQQQNPDDRSLYDVFHKCQKAAFSENKLFCSDVDQRSVRIMSSMNRHNHGRYCQEDRNARERSLGRGTGRISDSKSYSSPGGYSAIKHDHYQKKKQSLLQNYGSGHTEHGSVESSDVYTRKHTLLDLNLEKREESMWHHSHSNKCNTAPGIDSGKAIVSSIGRQSYQDVDLRAFSDKDYRKRPQISNKEHNRSRVKGFPNQQSYLRSKADKKWNVAMETTDTDPYMNKMTYVEFDLTQEKIKEFL